MKRLTVRQREILAIIAGHAESVTFDTVQELEMMGLVGGKGSQLRVTEQGKRALARAFGDPLPGNRRPYLRLVTP